MAISDDNLPPGVSQAALDGEWEELGAVCLCMYCGREIAEGHICADCEDELEALHGTRD